MVIRTALTSAIADVAGVYREGVVVAATGGVCHVSHALHGQARVGFVPVIRSSVVLIAVKV